MGIEMNRINWKRVEDCKVCGKSGCMVNTENEKMGYCFRSNRTFFVDIKGKCHYSSEGDSREKKPKERKSKTDENQETFDFGEIVNMYDYDQ